MLNAFISHILPVNAREHHIGVMEDFSRRRAVRLSLR